MSETPSYYDDVPESPELTQRDWLVLGLKEKGPQDPETAKLLQDWTLAQEAMVEAAKNTIDARTDFELKRAALYWDAGFEDDAWRTWDDVFLCAEQEGRADLCEKIRQAIDVCLGNPRRVL